MTEKKVIETQYGWYQKNDDKVNVDEIIGIVKTDGQTNSVQLKKEAQLSICEKRLIELEKENEQLKEENEFAKLLANHRGEMVSFANSLIQDIDDELTQKMWYQFKEEMYQKWKKKRGIE